MRDMKVDNREKRDKMKAFYKHKQHEVQRQIDILRSDPAHSGKGALIYSEHTLDSSISDRV